MGSQPSFFQGILMLNFPTRPINKVHNQAQLEITMRPTKIRLHDKKNKHLGSYRSILNKKTKQIW